MRLATIKGHVTATIKHRSMEGWRLLIAMPDSPDLAPQIVLDPLGAGIGQKVMISSDGSRGATRSSVMNGVRRAGRCSV